MFLKFLKRLDTEFPVEMKLHLVMENYGYNSFLKWLKLKDARSVEGIGVI